MEEALEDKHGPDERAQVHDGERVNSSALRLLM